MDQELINRVEAYFRNEMSKEEINQFMDEVEENAELKVLYEEYHLALEAIDVQVEDELRNQFSEWQDEGEVTQTAERRIFPKVWKMAASFALLAGVLYYFVFYLQDPLLPQELALNYYKLPESPGASKGAEEAIWAEGLVHYEKEEFMASIQQWENLEDLSNEQKYFLAHAYFNTQNYQNAIPLLKPISGSTDAYSFLADWYLALCYLAANQQDNFNNEIQAIIDDSNHSFREKALQLQKKSKKVVWKAEE